MSLSGGYDYILVQGSGLKDVGEYIMILNGRGTFIGSAIKTFRIIKKQDTGKKSIKGVRAGSVPGTAARAAGSIRHGQKVKL